MSREKTKSNFGSKIGRNVQHQKESKKSFGYLNLKGFPTLQLEEGTTRVDLDFLPYVVTDSKHPDRDPEYDIAVKDSLWYRRPIRVHRNIGADNETVICLRSIGKKCPVCEYREKKTKEGADKEEMKELYAKSRSLYIVIPLGLKKVEEKPHIWDISDFLFQDVLNDELEISVDDRNFPALDEGKTATLKIKWKSFGGNSYPEVRSIEFNDRDPYDESILDDIPHLDDMLKTLSYEALEAKFLEIELEEDGGDLKDVEEEKPTRRSRSTEAEDDKPVRRSRSVEKEQEQQEEPEDDQEEQEAPPTRRSSRTVEKEEKPTRGSRTVAAEKPSRSRSSDMECPHGHKFGVDTEEFKECDTCDIWDKCADKKEGK